MPVQPGQSGQSFRVLREATGPREENKRTNITLDNQENFGAEKEPKSTAEKNAISNNNKEGEGEERIAHLRFLGRQEEAVISHLGKELADILIYL